MNGRHYFVHNGVQPRLVRSPNYVVGEGAVRLIAAGFGDGEFAEVQVRVNIDDDGEPERWSPLYREGIAVRLSPGNNQLVEIVPGTYRVVCSSSTAVIYFWEATDESTTDRRTIFIHA